VTKPYIESLRRLTDSEIADTLGERKVLDGLLDALDREEAIANRILRETPPGRETDGQAKDRTGSETA
jgi:hypothetical protein